MTDYVSWSSPFDYTQIFIFMNKKMEFYIDIRDFPETSNFYETLRSFLTDKEKIKMFYNLTHK